ESQVPVIPDGAGAFRTVPVALGSYELFVWRGGDRERLARIEHTGPRQHSFDLAELAGIRARLELRNGTWEAVESLRLARWYPAHGVWTEGAEIPVLGSAPHLVLPEPGVYTVVVMLRGGREFSSPPVSRSETSVPRFTVDLGLRRLRVLTRERIALFSGGYPVKGPFAAREGDAWVFALPPYEYELRTVGDPARSLTVPAGLRDIRLQW